MLNPIEIITGALPNRDIRAVAGRLDCQTECVTDAAQAIARFRALGGEGWLCSAESKEIRRFSPAQPLPDPAASSPWPLCGETANGTTSIHLQRGTDGWFLTTLVRRDAVSPDDVLIKSVLQARDGQGDLCYETAWRNQAVAGIDELRPHAFRFIGFANQEKEV